MELTNPLIIENRSNRRNGYCYKLTNEGQYGLDVSFSDKMDVNESEMSIVIPFADGNRRDGVGDLLEITGIDTSRHIRNPLILFDHGKQVTLPIGLAEDPKTKNYTVQIDPVAKLATCKAFFYQGREGRNTDEHKLFCEQLFDLMAKRFVRAGSIGYTVINAKKLYPNYETGTPEGLHLLSVLMLEASAVVMPANADTVRKALCLKNVCGKPLSPMLVKSLSPYAPEKKVQMGHEKSLNNPIMELRKVCESFSDIQGLGPDYQKLFWNDKIKTAYWESFDGDEEESVQEVYRRLKKVDGVKQVIGESESSPDGEDWIQIWSRNEGKKALISVPEVMGSSHKDNKIPPAKWKPGVGAMKKFKDIRLKYRKAKGLRRRVKRGSPGSSVIHVRRKDLEKIREEAEKKGLKFQWIGTHKGGAEKVKLTGDDNSIDEMAKSYGVSMKTFQAKQKVKNMTHKKTKEMPLNTPDEVELGDVAGEVEESPQEPFSAQILRRIHEDYRILMQDYDEMIRMCEHEPTKMFLQKVLEGKETLLSDVENLFGEHHKELPGLEGMEGEEEGVAPEGMEEEAKEMEDPSEEVEGSEEEASEDDAGNTDAVPVDSSDEEDAPTPDEAVEGMQRKSLTQKEEKDLRNKYKKCMKCGKSGCKCNKCMEEPNTRKPGPCPGDGGRPSSNGKKPEAPKAQPSKLKENVSDKVGKPAKMDMTQDEATEVAENLDSVKEDISNKTSDTEDMKPHEKSYIKAAHTFLKDLSETQDFGDDHRMNSFHHSKLLGSIGQKDIGGTDAANAQNTVPPEGDFDNKRFKSESVEVDDSWQGGDASSDMGGETKSWHKAIKGASEFLTSLTTEKAFGDSHREQAMFHHKELDPFVSKEEGNQEGSQEESAETEEDPGFQPGDMDTKMLQEIQKRSKTLKEMEATIASLMCP